MERRQRVGYQALSGEVAAHFADVSTTSRGAARSLRAFATALQHSQDEGRRALAQAKRWLAEKRTWTTRYNDATKRVTQASSDISSAEADLTAAAAMDAKGAALASAAGAQLRTAQQALTQAQGDQAKARTELEHASTELTRPQTLDAHELGGHIELHRDSDPRADEFAPYRIFVDGEHRGQIRPGERHQLHGPARPPPRVAVVLAVLAQPAPGRRGGLRPDRAHALPAVLGTAVQPDVRPGGVHPPCPASLGCGAKIRSVTLRHRRPVNTLRHAV